MAPDRQASEQYFTFSQSFAHFFRQANGRPQVMQSFWGRSDLRRIFGMAAWPLEIVTISGLVAGSI